MAKKFKRITKSESAADRRRRGAARRKVEKEFPPKARKAVDASSGIGGQIRKARESKGMTWYAVAKAAGIPNSGTVRAIEQGQDAKLSSIEAIAGVLGLKLEVVDA